MTAKQFLNFVKGDFDIQIYRVFSLKRFFELINEKSITLIKPRSWDDPLENFILEAIEFEAPDLQILGETHFSFFGQCWTTQRENDALWRIYAPNKDGVIVATTARKLFTAISEIVGESETFIGKVKYFEKLTLYKEWSHPEVIKSIRFKNTTVMAKTLLMKLLAFKHEAEVRVLVYSPDNPNDNLLKIPINIHSLVSRVIFDPRMSKADYEENRNQLKECGFINDISQSNLYTLHEMHFNREKIKSIIKSKN